MYISVTEKTFKKNLKARTGLDVQISDYEIFTNELRELIISKLIRSLNEGNQEEVFTSLFGPNALKNTPISAFLSKKLIDNIKESFLVEIIQSNQLNSITIKTSTKKPNIKTIRNAEMLYILEPVMEDIYQLKNTFLQSFKRKIKQSIFSKFLTKGCKINTSSSTYINAKEIQEELFIEENIQEYKETILDILNTEKSLLDGYLKNKIDELKCFLYSEEEINENVEVKYVKKYIKIYEDIIEKVNE